MLPPGNFEPDRAAIYTFRARVAEKWRVGNVFLAGDAAHQAPPLFGQGLCAGLRDVANLVWKLRLVSQGRAGEDLLDTYESERRPHARYWVEKAATMAGLMQTTDPRDGRRPRRLPARQPGRRRTAVGTAARARPAHGRRDERAGPTVGAAASCRTGRRLDDLVGARFLLAATPELLDGLAPEVRAAVEADPETVVLTAPDEVGELLTSVEAAAVVVRPDRYVLGLADTPGGAGRTAPPRAHAAPRRRRRRARAGPA